MDSPTNTVRIAVRDHLLDLAWRQWSALGIAGRHTAPETRVVDPEALILLTMRVARYDGRLFDAVLQWMQLNGSFLNVQRLLNLSRQADPVSRAALSATAEILGKHLRQAPKWRRLATMYAMPEATPYFRLRDGRDQPLLAAPDEVFGRHGLLRTPPRERNLARAFPRRGTPTLLLRLRALCGVNIRCELLCLLGAGEEIHPLRAARLVGQSPGSIRTTLVEMRTSGLIQARTTARERYYHLSRGPLVGLLCPDGPTPWGDAVPLFRALGALHAGVDPEAPGEATPWRCLARTIEPWLAEAGLGQPLRDGELFDDDDYPAILAADITRMLAAHAEAQRTSCIFTSEPPSSVRNRPR